MSGISRDNRTYGNSRADEYGRGRADAKSRAGRGAVRLDSAIGDRPGAIDWISTILKYVLIIVLIMWFISAARSAYKIGYGIFSESAVDAEGMGKPVTVTITSDMSVMDIGRMLKKRGLVNESLVFPVQEFFSAYHGMIVPGTYELRSDMTPTQILAAISDEKAAVETETTQDISDDVSGPSAGMEDLSGTGTGLNVMPLDETGAPQGADEGTADGADSTGTDTDIH